MGEEMDKPKEKDKDPKKDVEKEIPMETKAKDGKEADTPKVSKLNQKNESKPCEPDFDCPAYPVKYSEGRIGRDSLRLSDDRKRLTHGSIVKSPEGSYVVERTLGTGAFGHVYKVSSLNNKYEVYAMKTELDQKEKLTNLRVELEVLKDVNDENYKYRQYFTKLIDRGRTNTFKFLIMELVSHTLQDIFTVMCKREMPLPSAAYAADRCAIAIDALHHRGFIHRDIKPHNFAVGLGRSQCQIYIFGFGIAKRYRDENKNIIIPEGKRARFVGTLKYCSRRCHEERTLMKRDDLESWAYMCVELFNEGNLSWDQMRTREETYSAKKLLFNNLNRIKAPPSFIPLMKYIDGLAFDEGVFCILPGLMKAVKKEAGFTEDTRLVWETENMPMSRPRKKGAKNRVQNDDDSSERKRREEKAERMAKKKRVEEELLKVMREIDEGDGTCEKKEEARRFIEDRQRRRSPGRRRSGGRRRRGAMSVEEEDDDEEDDDEDDSEEDRHRRKAKRSKGSRKPRSRLSQERTFEEKKGRKRSAKSKKSEKKRTMRKAHSRLEGEEKLLKLEDSPPRNKGKKKEEEKGPSAEKIEEDGERKVMGTGKNKESSKGTDQSPAVTPIEGSDKGKKK